MSLELTRYGSLDEAAGLVPDWQALMQDSGADVQFTPGWLAAWVRQFASGRRVSLIALRDGGRLVGLLPFVTSPVRAGLRRLRMARLAGPIPYFAVLQLPVLPEQAEAVWSRLMAADPLALLGADVLCLSHLSRAGEAFPALQAALTDLPPGLVQETDDTPPHALIPLADSFEAYMGRLSRKRRVKQRKAKEEIEAAGIMTLCLTGAEAEAFLPEFIARHDAQWRATGRLGHFGDWPENAGFLADALATLSANGAGRFYVQRDREGRFLAAQFCFVQGPTCLALLTARETGEDVARLGIGPHAQFERIARIIPEGVRRIDSGVGAYDHKNSLGAEMVPLARLLLFPAAQRARVAALRQWSDLVNLLYYRVWFLKLAPRLRRFGLAKAPLWSHWRETRL